MQQIRDIAEATIMQARKLKASSATFQALEASPAIRNVLFGLPLDNYPAPTTDDVVQFYFGDLLVPHTYNNQHFVMHIHPYRKKQRQNRD
jgi:hypothetical protein